MRARAVLLLALVSSTSCLADRTLTCSAADQCVRRGVQGECLLPGYCAFGASECASGRRWDSTAGEGLAGGCVELGDGGGGNANECGGLAILEGKPGSACGKCNSGAWVCDGTDLVVCDGVWASAVTLMEETVRATSTFQNNFTDFGAAHAVDGDDSTSWFSDGDDGGEPAVFTWEGQAEECIDKVEIISNANHANATYRSGYGFASVTVNVKAGAGQTVFTETVDLPGTPDPSPTITIGAKGWDVELEFHNNEHPDCGGFAELIVTGVRE